MAKARTFVKRLEMAGGWVGLVSPTCIPSVAVAQGVAVGRRVGDGRRGALRRREAVEGQLLRGKVGIQEVVEVCLFEKAEVVLGAAPRKEVEGVDVAVAAVVVTKAPHAVLKEFAF